MKLDKEFLRKEFSKAWRSDDMVNYCVGKVSTMAVLPDGGVVTVDKREIEKNFCFGESGYDFDDAVKAAAHARTSQEYFKRENMEGFKRDLEKLDEAEKLYGDYRLLIYPRQYLGQDEDCRLAGASFVWTVDVLDACGGSCLMSELPGKKISFRGQDVRVATNEEIGLIRAAYEAAAVAHEKKVDAYLKRYGLSKVHAWTYWRDE